MTIDEVALEFVADRQRVRISGMGEGHLPVLLAMDSLERDIIDGKPLSPTGTLYLLTVAAALTQEMRRQGEKIMQAQMRRASDYMSRGNYSLYIGSLPERMVRTSIDRVELPRPLSNGHWFAGGVDFTSEGVERSLRLFPEQRREGSYTTVFSSSYRGSSSAVKVLEVLLTPQSVMSDVKEAIRESGLPLPWTIESQIGHALTPTGQSSHFTDYADLDSCRPFLGILAERGYRVFRAGGK